MDIVKVWKIHESAKKITKYHPSSDYSGCIAVRYFLVYLPVFFQCPVPTITPTEGYMFPLPEKNPSA